MTARPEPRIASLDDDVSASFQDRLLLALGIWPEHARQAGEWECLEAAVKIRSAAHKFPMVCEDYGAVRAELEDLREAVAHLASDLSGQTFSAPSLDRVRLLLGWDEASEEDDW